MKKKLIRMCKAAVYGLIGTGFGMMIAEAERGYFAVGGEVLILPIFLLLAWGVPALIEDSRQIAKEIREASKND